MIPAASAAVTAQLGLQVNVSTAGKAYLTVDSSNFYVQLSLSSNDSDFNNTHPRLQVLLAICCTRLAFKLYAAT